MAEDAKTKPDTSSIDQKKSVYFSRASDRSK